MSRTYRKRSYSYFRKPKHLSILKAENRALEELIEAGCIVNRVKQRANPNGSKSVPSDWDDLDISARGEIYENN